MRWKARVAGLSVVAAILTVPLAAHAGSLRTDDSPPLEGAPATTVAPPAEPPSGQVVTIIVPGEPEQKAPPKSKPKPKPPAKASHGAPAASASASAREPSGDSSCAHQSATPLATSRGGAAQPRRRAATRARRAELHRAGGAVAPDGIRDGGAREPSERRANPHSARVSAASSSRFSARRRSPRRS